MLPFGVTNPATVPQRSEIPEGLMNYPVMLLLISILPRELELAGMNGLTCIYKFNYINNELKIKYIYIYIYIYICTTFSFRIEMFEETAVNDTVSLDLNVFYSPCIPKFSAFRYDKGKG